MKMSHKTFDKLVNALDVVMSKHSLKVITEHRRNIPFVKNQFISFCWSMFNASKFDSAPLYANGLNDSHIETALKRILSDFE